MSYYRGQDVYYDNTALLAEQYYPGLHVLNLPKSIGDPVTGAWAARNISTSVVGFARLQVDLGGHASQQGPVIPIPANSSSSLGSVSLTISTGSGLLSGSVSILETTAAGAFVRTVAQHGFTVLIGGGGGGAMLEAIGDPTIV